MAAIKSFRELKVYQAARIEARQVFEVTRAFPSEEKYSLTDQIRRSSRAVNAMIAEAMETQAWFDHALDCGYLPATKHHDFDAAWQGIGAMLQRMLEKADTFCPPVETRP